MPGSKRNHKTNSSSLPLDSVRHKDKRANIPTEELRDFVREEEATTKNDVQNALRKCVESQAQDSV